MRTNSKIALVFFRAVLVLSVVVFTWCISAVEKQGWLVQDNDPVDTQLEQENDDDFEKNKRNHPIYFDDKIKSFVSGVYVLDTQYTVYKKVHCPLLNHTLWLFLRKILV